MLKNILKTILIKNTTVVASVACVSVATASGIAYVNVKEKNLNEFINSKDKVQLANSSMNTSSDDLSETEEKTIESKEERITTTKESKTKEKNNKKSNNKTITSSKVTSEKSGSEKTSTSLKTSGIGNVFKSDEGNKLTSSIEEKESNVLESVTEDKKDTKDVSEQATKAEEKTTSTTTTTTTTTKTTSTTTKPTTTKAPTTTTKKTTTTTKKTTTTTRKTTARTTTTTKASASETKASTQETTTKAVSPLVTLVSNAYNKIKNARSLSYSMESSILKSTQYIKYNKNQNRKTYKENINGVLVEYYYEGDGKYCEPSERKPFEGYHNIWRRDNGGEWVKTNSLYSQFLVDIGFLDEIVNAELEKTKNGIDYYKVTVSKKSANAYMNTFTGYGANTFSTDMDVVVGIDSNGYIRKVTVDWGKVSFDFEIDGIGSTEISRPANLT